MSRTAGTWPTLSSPTWTVGWPIFRVSAATREGLQELIFALARHGRRARAPQPVLEPTRLVLRPSAVDDSGFTVEHDTDGVLVVRGAKPERWVRQTNFDNDEAVGYLADRLARLGVEDELAKTRAPSRAARYASAPGVRLAAHRVRRPRVHPRPARRRLPAGRWPGPADRRAAPRRSQGPSPTDTRRAGASRTPPRETPRKRRPTNVSSGACPAALN